MLPRRRIRTLPAGAAFSPSRLAWNRSPAVMPAPDNSARRPARLGAHSISRTVRRCLPSGVTTICITPKGQATTQDLQPIHFSPCTNTLSSCWLMATTHAGRAFTVTTGYRVTLFLVLITVIRGKSAGVKTCCSPLCAITQATSQPLHPMHLRLSWFIHPSAYR